jgi:hypothetical protein
MHHANQLASLVALLHLTVEQAGLYLPPAHLAPSTTRHKPPAKVGRESIKVEIQTITRKEWEAARSHSLSQIVDEQMGHVLGARAELKHGKDLGEGIDGQPQPEHLSGAAQPGAQFVQLQVWEVQMAEEALVQGVRVLASTRQPGGNSRLSVALRRVRRQKHQALREAAESTMAMW